MRQIEGADVVEGAAAGKRSLEQLTIPKVDWPANPFCHQRYRSNGRFSASPAHLAAPRTRQRAVHGWQWCSPRTGAGRTGPAPTSHSRAETTESSTVSARPAVPAPPLSSEARLATARNVRSRWKSRRLKVVSIEERLSGVKFDDQLPTGGAHRFCVTWETSDLAPVNKSTETSISSRHVFSVSFGPTNYGSDMPSTNERAPGGQPSREAPSNFELARPSPVHSMVKRNR